MKEQIINTRNKFMRFIYKFLIKPIFFKIDPEKIHNYITYFGKFIGSNFLTRNLTKFLFSYSNQKLSQNILGINFKSPVGLAAGFDKDARILNIIPETGFGFEEIGSITGEACIGNPKPRLWRIKEFNSLAVYYGLKNIGCEEISKKLKNKKSKIPLLISIAKTNSLQTVDLNQGIKDYLKSYKILSNLGDAHVINISCPNSFGGQPFHDKYKLNQLLKELTKIKSNKPILLKLSPDLTKKQLDDIILISAKYKVSGFVCSNLTKEINHLNKDREYKGGFSGKLLEELSNNQIKYIYKKTKGKFIIIGVGGIFSAQDAYKKIKLGASLVELITGMIYEGPQLISEINQGLVELLKKDRYKNISEAIGVDNK